jgi:hypothetical protein
MEMVSVQSDISSSRSSTCIRGWGCLVTGAGARDWCWLVSSSCWGNAQDPCYRDVEFTV